MEIGIVGMGFSGMMTAAHLIQKSNSPIVLHLIESADKPGFGPAYQTASKKHLLNIRAGNMGCTESGKQDFVDWIKKKPLYQSIDVKLINDMFLPRAEYGEYLNSYWTNILNTKKDYVRVINYNARAVDCKQVNNRTVLTLDNGINVEVDKLVLATGNEIPSNPRISNQEFYTSQKYLANPWTYDALDANQPGDKILIIGNGLTMADVVLSIHEKKFNGTIYTISPHGFTILPHRHNGTHYTALRDELKEPYDLVTLFVLFRKHIKLIRQFGLSAEPVIDSVRSVSQQIWIKLSLEDKKRFMRHVRHLWGLARHRLPAHVHDFLFDLRVNDRLKVIKGRLKNMVEENGMVKVEYYHSNKKQVEVLEVHKVINCTGPQTNIAKSSNKLLAQMTENGMLQPDALGLGILTDTNGAVINSDHRVNNHVFTLGGNLRGMLWETTAVPEIRVQAEKLAELLLKSH